MTEKLPAINWEKIYGRLRKAREDNERVLSPTAEDRRRLLRRRAHALAEEPLHIETAKEMQVVEFVLGYERYGVETSYVQEIYPLRELTPIPCTPSFVLGVINVRGRILSVVDLRQFFNLPAKGLTDLNKVVLLRSGGMEMGVLADAVKGTRSIRLADLLEAPPTLTGIGAEYLRGVTAEPLMVLAAEIILADPRLIVQEEVEETAVTSNNIGTQNP